MKGFKLVGRVIKVSDYDSAYKEVTKEYWSEVISEELLLIDLLESLQEVNQLSFLLTVFQSKELLPTHSNCSHELRVKFLKLLFKYYIKVK